MRKYFVNKKGEKGIFLAKIILVFYIFIALFSNFLANDQPFVCKCNGSWDFPLFEKQMLVKRTQEYYKDCGFIIFPPIRYHSNTMDKKNNNYTSPFGFQEVTSFWYRHWLGTDKLGRDIAAGIVHGTRNSLIVGVFSILFALIFGVSLGLCMGYFYNDKLKFNIWQLISVISIGLVSIFYIRYQWINEGILFKIVLFILAISFLVFVVKQLGKISRRKYTFPLDLLLYRVIEIRKSIPGLFLLLAALTIFSTPSVWNLVIIISLLAFTDFARFVRGETLAIKQEAYITTAYTMGIGDFRIIWKYIFPNLLNTLIVVSCFSIAGAILLESTLSFLGLGLPLEEASWGKMLAESRNLKAWWMVMFPGLAIFLLLISLHKLGDHVSIKN